MTNKLILSSRSKEIIGDTFLSRLSSEDLYKKINEAYLGILANDTTLFNPFEKIPSVAGDKFAEYVAYVMSQPEYFYFIIKYVFGMDSFPQQCLILKELYTHKFPLLIGTRGLGKAISVDSPVLTDSGWIKMGDISLKTKVYGRDGKLHNVTDISPQGRKQVWLVKFADGRESECCEDHLWYVRKGTNNFSKEKTISTKDMYNDKLFFSGSSGKHAFKYKVPNNKPIQYTKKELSVDPYILGCLLGDGCMTTLTPKIASDDDFIINEFRNRLSNFSIKRDISNNNYTIVDSNTKCEKCTCGSIHRNSLTAKICRLKLNVDCYNKFIPDEYKTSSIDDRFEIVRGLLDTDGSINKHGSVEFTNVCERLVDDLIDILRSLGISCIKSKDNRAGETHVLPSGKETIRKDYFRVYINTNEDVFKLPRKLKRIKKTNSLRRTHTAIVDIQPTNKYTEMQCISVDSDDNTYIIKDHIVTHNSITLALYMLIRMILIPGTRCIITSAGFRQAKVVFDYMERIWDKAPILQSCFKGGKNGPTHGTDVWTFRLGDSLTYALPVGPDGSKVRGYRANCVHRDTLVQTDKGLVKISDFKNKNCEYVININKELEAPETFYSTELVDVYEAVTENGYSIKFSKIHQLNGPNGWIKGSELKEGDLVELDNNDFFPSEFARHGANILDEVQIFYSGIINLSTLAAKEVPWYILQSPRNIVYRYLKMLFGESWINKSTTSKYSEKIKQLQILLLKFNFISKISTDKDRYTLTVVGQHIGKDNPTDKIKTVRKLDVKDNLYDFEILGTNSFRGGGFVNHNCLISDEFSSMNRQVFEEVMSGFLSVAASPVEQIKQNASQSLMKQLYIPIPVSDGNSNFLENQLILSGTAYYKINHFYAYFKKWNQIIHSETDPTLLKDIFTDEVDKKNVKPSNYSVLRIPVELTAHGYMDMEQIARIKVSTTKDVYLREYGAAFNDDSDGFFKKSLIDACTCQDGDKDMFPPALYGTKIKKYVYGVDPAYEGDNFAVVIIEINGSHRRVVHAWTTQASDHKQRLRDGVITEHDYYHYCARKIRDLMKRFPCEYIALDSQGGGNALMEAFRDITKIKEGENIILPTIEPEEKTKETDLLPGLHIIKVINFTSDWISKANYALKKDMEDKTIRFPVNDAISYALAEYYDESMGDSKELYDTLDDCIFEIEELKKELTTIVVSETTTGREKFDTPSVKVGINRKGRLKKDRYSALIMANFVAREILDQQNRMEGTDIVNMSNYIFSENKVKLFRGNTKIADQLNKLYGSM